MKISTTKKFFRGKFCQESSIYLKVVGYRNENLIKKNKNIADVFACSIIDLTDRVIVEKQLENRIAEPIICLLFLIFSDTVNIKFYDINSQFCQNFRHLFDPVQNHGIVSVWVMIPPQQTTTQQFLLSPQTLKILTSSPRQTKVPNTSNTFNMFNNNIPILKQLTHMLIP